ncbi:uracil-DNA glycosylase family protein [Paenibacillus sp. FSL R10-2734]|uniref:uracil-DNA glycosylase family protein n=1 Tax=Paenibacillus sp. FSL R10-2734 TaxID=2954691 RepID=UPI0030D97CD0
MLISNHLQEYKAAVLSLPKGTALTKEDLLVDKLLMKRSGKLEMYYAPHNEYMNPSAKVIIIGLTPGFTQMRIAMQEAVIGLEAGLSDEEVCKRAKEAARFAGAMRHTLIHMLDTLGLHQYLNLTSCDELFQVQQTNLHTISLLRFPVFVEKKNYSGVHPKLLSDPFLREYALLSLEQELDILSQALIIPLGKTVEATLQLLVSEGKLDHRRCLWGFPHPSGANGHRFKQFASYQENMTKILQDHLWKD